MTSFFFSVFNYIASNRWAQIVLSAGVVLLVIKAKAEHDEARGRRQEKEAGARRTRKTIKAIKRESDETSDRVAEARNTVDHIDDAGKLSDDVRAILFGGSQGG